jgi:ubiquinone/menaquinone biosynthesis C-methylase UbiE
MTDDLADINRRRWNALVDANVQYARPMLELTPDAARDLVNLNGIVESVAGKEVLVLAGGGGQQSAAFALLGASVTVLDLSDKQLERDRQAAEHYGLTIRTLHGDMRQLDIFAAQSFDLVYQPYSINFVPSIAPVIAGVAAICRPGAFYYLDWANPFVQTIDPERGWTGAGYLLQHAYVDGREVTQLYPNWTIEDENGAIQEYEGPREFVHTFSTMINTLVSNGFVILRASEYLKEGSDHEPGSWDHYVNTAPPYLGFWTQFRPDAFH